MVGRCTRFHVLARSSLSLSNGIWYKCKFLSEPTFVPDFRIHLVCLAPPKEERGEREREDNFVPLEKRSRDKILPVLFYLFIRGGSSSIKSMTFKTLIRNIEEREREREGFSLNFHHEGVMIVTQCTRIRSREEKVFFKDRRHFENYSILFFARLI